MWHEFIFLCFFGVCFLKIKKSNICQMIDWLWRWSSKKEKKMFNQRKNHFCILKKNNPIQHLINHFGKSHRILIINKVNLWVIFYYLFWHFTLHFYSTVHCLTCLYDSTSKWRRHFTCLKEPKHVFTTVYLYIKFYTYILM